MTRGARIRWQDTAAKLGSEGGRFELLYSVLRRSWPVLSRTAALYRRTLICRTRIAAIVGSFGKTTTTRAVMTALGGDVSRLFEFNVGSSLAVALFRIKPWNRYWAVEVATSGPGIILPLARMIRPDIAVATCIGSEHNRSFKTLEATRQEKSEMVRLLPDTGLAVLNGDDPNVLWMKGRTGAKVITFGCGDSNDVRAENVFMDWPRGMGFTLRAGTLTRQMHTHMIGRHMAYPILAAVAAAQGEGLPLEPILPLLEALEPTPGRMQPVRLANGAYVLRDDYKSALETIETALDSLSEIPAPQKIAVLGEISEPPGSQGPRYKALGEKAAMTATRVVLITKKRGLEGYRSGLNQAGFPGDAVYNAKSDVLDAAEAVRRDLGPGDVVLIKGRDNQRLERVAFALMGVDVRCDRPSCTLRTTRCATCESLQQGRKRLSHESSLGASRADGEST